MIPLEALSEIKRLNENLERLHQDAEKLDSWKPVVSALAGEIKTLNARFGAVAGAAKQISILNQILLQLGKAQGFTAMFGRLLDGINIFAKRAKR